MVLINLIHQLPILESTTLEQIVWKNQVSLALGLVLYALLGGAIYTNKVPDFLLSPIPDKRYLLLIVGVDLALFFFIHRFQYGYFPILSVPDTQEKPQRTSVSRRRVAFADENIKENNSDISKVVPFKETTHFMRDGPSDDVSTYSDVNIENDLESTFKKPGLHKQSELPDEVSVPGGSYFNDEERPKIENWELDEYTHDEYVPEGLSDQPSDELMYE